MQQQILPVQPLCAKTDKTVIWYMNLCNGFLQNPHPVLFLAYYSSKSLLFIEKLFRVKMKMTNVWSKMQTFKWEI